jgi:hypothetical protein
VIFLTDKQLSADYSAIIHQPSEELKMKCNAGTVDRSIRVIAGLALIALAATGTVGAWGYIGIVPLLTGIVGFCPAYTMLGMSTCSTEKK